MTICKMTCIVIAYIVVNEPPCTARPSCLVMACLVMVYIVTACIVMAYIVMACLVMAYIVTAYFDTARIGMVYIVMDESLCSARPSYLGMAC